MLTISYFVILHFSVYNLLQTFHYNTLYGNGSSGINHKVEAEGLFLSLASIHPH